jgi:glycosyltransferase involved in cell wall biosynthesis
MSQALPSLSPRVSVGMPVYNAAQWLDASVTAILEQTYQNIELVLSDNASTDGTPAVCAALAARDSRVRYFAQPTNLGANNNYSFVAAQSRGEYFKWASSSDFCAPNFVERCVTCLDENPDIVLVCPRTSTFTSGLDSAVPYDSDLSLLQDDANERFRGLFAYRGLNNAMNGLMRRTVTERVLPIGVFRAADIVMLAEIALAGKIAVLPERLFFRRMSVDTATALKSEVESDRHLVPTVRKPLRWQAWKYRWALVRAAMRGAPGGREWLATVGYALRQVMWGRAELWNDIRDALR